MGLAFLITADNLQLLSERKVLKADEYAALLDARAVLDTAQAQAERVRDGAHALAEAQRRQGYEDGWRAAQAEFAERHLAQAWTAEAERHAQRERLAQLVVGVIARFLAEAPPQALLARALERVDALLAAEPVVTVCVAPARVVIAEAALREVMQARRRAGSCRVVADAALGPDDCRVVTASGHVEIGLGAQIAALRRSLARESAGGALA